MHKRNITREILPYYSHRKQNFACNFVDFESMVYSHVRDIEHGLFVRLWQLVAHDKLIFSRLNETKMLLTTLNISHTN